MCRCMVGVSKHLVGISCSESQTKLLGHHSAKEKWTYYIQSDPVTLASSEVQDRIQHAPFHFQVSARHCLSLRGWFAIHALKNGKIWKSINAITTKHNNQRVWETFIFSRCTQTLEWPLPHECETGRQCGVIQITSENPFIHESLKSVNCWCMMLRK